MIYNTAITGLNNTATTKLESGSGARAISTVIICNTQGTDINLTLYAVPSGGSANITSGSAMIVNALTIPAGETLSFDQEKFVLGTGDELRAFATATGLSATVSTLVV